MTSMKQNKGSLECITLSNPNSSNENDKTVRISNMQHPRRYRNDTSKEREKLSTKHNVYVSFF